MQTIEVPGDTWPQTFNEFSAMREGWLISVDALGVLIEVPKSRHRLKPAARRVAGLPVASWP